MPPRAVQQGPPLVLNVAEKNSVAKEVSRILSQDRYEHKPFSPELATAFFRNPKHNGSDASSGAHTPVYEFPFVLDGGPVRMVFTAVAGHLRNLSLAAGASSWETFPPESLLRPAVTAVVRTNSEDPRQQAILANLRRQCARCSRLVLWLDCDREGENIAFEVVDVWAGVHTSGTARSAIKRAHFSTLVPEEIMRVVHSLGRLDPRLSAAVDARQEIDLRVGYAFTRFQTTLLRRSFALSSVVSYGPCQFPTLGFIVRRFQRRELFAPAPFWSLDLQHRDEASGAVTTFAWERGRVYDPASAAALHHSVLSAPHAVVLEATVRQITRRRPVPLTTVTLQTMGAQHLRLSAKQTLEAAEALYTSGLISYPRTETDVFTKEADLRGTIARLASPLRARTDGARAGAGLVTQPDAPGVGRRGYGPAVMQPQAYADLLLGDYNPDDGSGGQAGQFCWPSDGGHNDGAHPPIHPLRPVPPGSLAGPEAAVYELVLRHFLASCSRDGLGSQTRVTVQCGTEKFSASGLMIIDYGYLRVFPYEKWSTGTLPRLYNGLTFVPHALSLRQGMTTPPPLLTVAGLLGAMHKHGIGTDATMATHIDNVLARKYAEENDGSLTPTPLGLALVRAYDALRVALAAPETRARMEYNLGLVSAGRRSGPEVVAETCAEMLAVFRKVQRRAARMLPFFSDALQPLRARAKTIMENFSTCGHCKTCALELAEEEVDADAAAAAGSGGVRAGKLLVLSCPRCGGFGPGGWAARSGRSSAGRAAKTESGEADAEGADDDDDNDIDGHEGDEGGVLSGDDGPFSSVVPYRARLKLYVEKAFLQPLVYSASAGWDLPEPVLCPYCDYQAILVDNLRSCCPYCRSHPVRDSEFEAKEDADAAAAAASVAPTNRSRSRAPTLPPSQSAPTSSDRAATGMGDIEDGGLLAGDAAPSAGLLDPFPTGGSTTTCATCTSAACPLAQGHQSTSVPVAPCPVCAPSTRSSSARSSQSRAPVPALSLERRLQRSDPHNAPMPLIALLGQPGCRGYKPGMLPNAQLPAAPLPGRYWSLVCSGASCSRAGSSVPAGGVGAGLGTGTGCRARVTLTGAATAEVLPTACIACINARRPPSQLLRVRFRHQMPSLGGAREWEGCCAEGCDPHWAALAFQLYRPKDTPKDTRGQNKQQLSSGGTARASSASGSTPASRPSAAAPSRPSSVSASRVSTGASRAGTGSTSSRPSPAASRAGSAANARPAATGSSGPQVPGHRYGAAAPQNRKKP